MTRTSDRQLLLLDTHVWIWLMLESGELAIGARAAINRAAASGQLRIAAISVWEAALLASRGRIALGRPLSQWRDLAVSAPGISVQPLLPQIAVEACCLPETLASRSSRPHDCRDCASHQCKVDDARPKAFGIRRPRTFDRYRRLRPDGAGLGGAL